MTNGKDIDDSIKFLTGTTDDVIAYTIDGTKAGDSTKQILVIFNPNQKAEDITLPEGDWKVCINREKAGTDTISNVSGKISAEPVSCTVLVK